MLSAQTQPCWPSAAADLLRCDRVDQALAGDIAPATAWLRAWPEAPQPARSTPWWRSRSCANERRYSTYTTIIPALELVCLFIKQATANMRSLPMVAAVAQCRATSTRAAGFLKATCLGQPLCVEPDAICEIRSTRDDHCRHALLLGRWVVRDERVVDHGSLARSPLGPAGWRGRSGQQGCQG